MIFVVTGDGEHGPVSITCKTPVTALQQARRLADDGARNVMIDAGGHEYAPADFQRHFIQADSSGTS